MWAFLFLVLLSSCSSLNDSTTNTQNSSGSTNSTSIKNSSDLRRAIAKQKRDQRIADLEKYGYRDPSAAAELNILKAGGTMREAELAGKLYARGLSDEEMSEKRTLEQARLTMYQEYLDRSEGSTASPRANSDPSLVAPPRH